jgi:hypothetical protein
MFRSKKTMSVTIFLIFLITISIIKNKTRLLEKEIYELSKKIAIKEKELNDIELDFYYLTSPVIIEKKIENLNYNNYSPMEYSKIFLDIENFMNIHNKLTILKNQYEKEIKNN